MKTRFNNKLAFDYILNAVNEEYFCQAVSSSFETASDLEKINFVYNAFLSEFWDGNLYEQKRCKNNIYKGFEEWLRGQPGSLDIDCWDDDILKIALQWNSLPENYTDSQWLKIRNNWYIFISLKFFQLKYKLEHPKKSRARKTKDEYVLISNCGYGWDEVLTEDTWPALKEQLVCYKLNDPKTEYNWKKRRVKIEL